jgi:hypothetical protein
MQSVALVQAKLQFGGQVCGSGPNGTLIVPTSLAIQGTQNCFTSPVATAAMRSIDAALALLVSIAISEIVSAPFIETRALALTEPLARPNCCTWPSVVPTYP